MIHKILRNASNWLFTYFCKYWPKFIFFSIFDCGVNVFSSRHKSDCASYYRLIRRESTEWNPKKTAGCHIGPNFGLKTTAILVRCHIGTAGTFIQKKYSKNILRLGSFWIFKFSQISTRGISGVLIPNNNLEPDLSRVKLKI